MRRIVLGTAGHIDHGKTSLVKALTGYDTDRLPEEKERGITIVLGFCNFITSGGDEISIIDVPGHEKFIKTMIAGASGIDMVMLVIAADDGVMPQTREHLDICALLGIKHGIIVLTKVDLVDNEWLAFVQEDIRKFVAGTFLQAAPILPVSSVTNEGIPALKATIENLAQKIVERKAVGLARLPIDRIFTMKGFGTVVTGTLISGELSIGDDVEILPSNKAGKIRGLEQHGKKTQNASAGSRVAANFTSMENDKEIKGELLVKKGTFYSSELLDVYINNASSENIVIKNQFQLRFLTLTSRIMATVWLLGAAQLKPKESGFAQIKLESPLPCVVGDKFILLGSTKVQTIGGGVILNPLATRAHKESLPKLLDELSALKDASDIDRAKLFIKKSAQCGISLKELSFLLNVKEEILMKGLTAAASKGEIMRYGADGKHFINTENFVKIKENLLAILEEFHQKNPAKAGMVKEELKGRVASSASHNDEWDFCAKDEARVAPLYELALNNLATDNKAVINADIVLLKKYEKNASGLAQEIKIEIENIYKSKGIVPPFLQELKSEFSRYKPSHIEDTVNVLLREKTLIKISEGYFLHKDNFNELQTKLVELLKQHQKIDASGFKSLTQASRKYTIPLLERFDMLGVTIRDKDDTRRLGRALLPT